MLIELRVADFALIDELKFSFEPGLNVLSGETGAGKSIVIGAINLLLGERAAIEQIRQGQERALIEGIFSSDAVLQSEIDHLLESAGIETGDELIVAREVFRNGRSIARVNGRTVPLSFLKEMGQLLVDLHGQHQHQSLLRPEKHLDLLDASGGEQIANARNRLADLFKRRQDLMRELSELGDDSAERERRLDIYTFQVKEIGDAKLKPGEDAELARREKVLAHAEKICSIASLVYMNIYTGTEDGSVEALIDRIHKTRSLLADAARIDQALTPLVDLLGNTATNLEEVSHELRQYQSELEFDPVELVIIQERLNLINALKRKYGPSVEEVLNFARRVEDETERLKNSEAVVAQLENEIRAIEKLLREESLVLRHHRRMTAASLERLLEDCLTELTLPDARFEVKFVEKGTFSAKGMEQVEFLFSANRGEAVKPLAKIISGGEVSRVMLALKSILARQDLVPTLIFDEVDAGIGGATVQAVAEKLAHLAEHHQVLCVTHSSQIAAMADGHYQLFKEAAADRTLTMAAKLSADERREELARMLDGASIDRVSLQHADSLLERAQRFKKAKA